MKRMSRLLSVLLGAVLVAGTILIAGCQTEGGGTTDPEREVCLVEVEGGSGGGYYYKDTNCTVVADEVEGKQFMKWVSGNRELSDSSTYVFTVTEDISLEAVFADDVDVTDLCDINVKFGTGSGRYFAGTERELKVSEEYSALTFAGWEATYKDDNGQDVTEVISTQNPYTLTVERDMDIKACFESATLATPDNSEGQHFRIAANGAYEFDREKNADGSRKTVFVLGVAYLQYRMYDSADPEAQPIAEFRIVPIANPTTDGAKAYLENSEGQRQDLKGPLGDLYHDEDAGKAQIRILLGIETGKTYYFDVQAIAVEDSPFVSSEISVRGPGCTF